MSIKFATTDTMVKNTSFLHSEDVEIDNDYYDIVIVDGWQEEMDEDWDGQGEVIAEICLDPPNFDPIPRKEIVQRPATPQDDCANLSWLLNFKLDGLIGLNQNTEETVKGSVAAEKKTSDEEHPVKKPPYTYTELIELALKEKGQLTVSQIYRWISDRYPFFKPQDDRWKNSVRHNLSINPHFRKGAKAPRGAGHLWTIVSLDAIDNKPRQIEPEQDCMDSMDQEAAIAAANILQHYNTEFLNPVSAAEVAAECGLLDTTFF